MPRPSQKYPKYRPDELSPVLIAAGGRDRPLQNHPESHPDQLLPVLSAVGGFRSQSEESAEDCEPMASPFKDLAKQSNTIAERQKFQPTSSKGAPPSIGAPSQNLIGSPITAETEHVDLARSDEDEGSTSSHMEAHPGPSATTTVNAGQLLDNTLLDYEVHAKFLKDAWRQFPNQKPPFIRLHRNVYEKTVMLALGDGQLPERPVLAPLVSRRWDSKYSYYILDRNRERLIVNPNGGKYKHDGRECIAYRSWSGQGNVFEKTPVAFAFKGDLEAEQSNSKEFEKNSESNFGNFAIQATESRDDLEEHLVSTLGRIPIQAARSQDQDHLLGTSQISDRESEDQELIDAQRSRTRSEVPQSPVSQESPAHSPNDEDTRLPQEALAHEHGAELLDQSPPFHDSPLEPSNSDPKISEVAAGKRPASDTIDNDRRVKRVHPVYANTLVDSSMSARVPQNLTLYKQERTVLHVLIPGSSSDVVPIKLRSAMSLPTFFSSVSVAARVINDERMSIAVILGGVDGSQDKTIILRRNMVDSFEYFLEVVDEAACWEDEGGRLELQLQLRWTFEVDIQA